MKMKIRTDEKANGKIEKFLKENTVRAAVFRCYGYSYRGKSIYLLEAKSKKVLEDMVLSAERKLQKEIEKEIEEKINTSCTLEYYQEVEKGKISSFTSYLAF